MAKQISLAGDRGYATVDDEDYEFLMQWKWRLVSGYAARNEYLGMIDGRAKSKTIFMHTDLNKTPKGMTTDHKNGIRLDNRKTNLRTVTKQQNQWNRPAGKSSFTGIKGVGWCKQTKKWKATIFAHGKRRTLGRFSCIGAAIKSYNAFASQYHGEYARLNQRSA